MDFKILVIWNAKYCSHCVCVSLDACPLRYLKNQTSINFWCILLMAVAWSFSDNNAMHYVLRVFWMMSWFYIMVHVQISHLMSFFRWHHHVATRGKSLPCLIALFALPCFTNRIISILAIVVAVCKLRFPGCMWPANYSFKACESMWKMHIKQL